MRSNAKKMFSLHTALQRGYSVLQIVPRRKNKSGVVPKMTTREIMVANPILLSLIHINKNIDSKFRNLVFSCFED